jgi:hypothetical protein
VTSALEMSLALPWIVACGTAGETDGPGHVVREPVYLDAPGIELPATMHELGLFPKPGDFEQVHESALEFHPVLELWSNGSSKQRHLVLPPGQAVNNTERGHWDYPPGTLFFKTFFFAREGTSKRGALVPVETRVLQRTGRGYEYAVYAWDTDGTEAELLELDRPVPVSVEVDGESFEHMIPAKLDCRKCHESQPVDVIGFDELRLNAPREPGLPTQLEELAALGVFSDPIPKEPDAIEHPDALTAAVLGYLHGNCAHCHNGGTGASSAFDMRHPVALENLINRDTEGEALAGIRVVPGHPEQSALYLAFTRDEAIPDIQPMPPIGVQRVDTKALQMLEEFIKALPEQDEGSP